MDSFVSHCYEFAMASTVAKTSVASSNVGRRDALALLGGLAALLPARGFAQAPAAIDRAAFLQASSLATGVPANELTGMADALLAAFRDQSPAITQLIAFGGKGAPADIAAAVHGTPLEALCRQLAAAWYTGIAGTKLVSYEDALAWKVAGYTAVPGECGGEFGAWADPPTDH